jgi:hypothetical protein
MSVIAKNELSIIKILVYFWSDNFYSNIGIWVTLLHPKRDRLLVSSMRR